MMEEAVFFNLDGTLAEMTRSYDSIYERAAEEAGIDVENGYSRYQELFFKFFKKGFAFPRRQAIDSLLREEDCFDPVTVENFARSWEEAEADSVEIKDGARDVLEEMSSERVLGIVSNGTGRLQRMKLEELGIRELFDSVVVSSEIGFRKPEEGFFEIAKGSVDAERYFVVSHLPKRDIIGGRRAGLKGVWLTDSEKEVPEDFALKINSLSELPGRLGEIDG